MDPNWVSKKKLEDEATKYIQENGVGPLLEGLMKDLILEKPDDPIPFLIAKLEEQQAARE